MKDLQETFDELLVHMRALNGIKSVRADGTPVYKTPNGESGCPVGRLISASCYNAKLENMRVISEPVSSILKRDGYNIDLCQAIQDIHDSRDSSCWEDCMNILAREIGLTYTAPMCHIPREGIDVLGIRDFCDMNSSALYSLQLLVKTEKMIKETKADLFRVAGIAAERATV